MSVPSGAYARKKIAGGVTYYGKPITGDIIEVVPGSCDFSNPELDCKAAGTYQVTVENATLTDIVWSTTFGEISTGQGTETVQISTETGFDVEFDLTITATVVPDNLSEPFPGTRTETFNHTHTDTSIPMTIVSINRDSGGTCIYPVDKTCQATSVFSATTANGNGNKTYLWEVTGEGTISGSKTDSTVTVVGLDDNDNDTYDVKVTINDRTQTGATITQQFVDTKVEDIPINITSINRDSGGTCDYLTSGSCVAQSVYSVQYEESNGTVFYIWKVDGGASIVGSVADATVTVNGPDTGTDDSYNVTCTVTDDNGSDTDSQAFSDTKTEIPPLVIDSINRDSGGTCDFYEGSEGCSAESTYSVSISGSVSAISYQWLVDNGATISGSSTSATVIIDGSTTTTNDSYNVTCQVTDNSGSDTQVTQFSDTKTELASIKVDSINRTSGGTCEYQTGGAGCSAQSSYDVTISNSISAITYQWVVDNGATISGSSTGSTVTVNGPTSTLNDSYNVTCQVTDNSGSDTQVTQFSDTKTLLPIDVTNVIRTSGGTCEYPSGGTCVAQSVYSASYTNGDGNTPSYLWSVDNGATISGSSIGTTVTVNGTDTGSNDSYNVTCQLTDTTGNDSFQRNFTDNKTQELPVGVEWGIKADISSLVPTGYNAVEMSVSADGNTIIVCYYNGSLDLALFLRSTDGGDNFGTMSNGDLPTLINLPYFNANVNNMNEMRVQQNDGSGYVTTNGGANWTFVPFASAPASFLVTVWSQDGQYWKQASSSVGSVGAQSIDGGASFTNQTNSSVGKMGISNSGEFAVNMLSTSTSANPRWWTGFLTTQTIPSWPSFTNSIGFILPSNDGQYVFAPETSYSGFYRVKTDGSKTDRINMSGYKSANWLAMPDDDSIVAFGVQTGSTYRIGSIVDPKNSDTVYYETSIPSADLAQFRYTQFTPDGSKAFGFNRSTHKLIMSPRP